MLLPTILVAALVSSGDRGNSCKLNLQTDLDSNKEPLVLAPSGKSWDFTWPTSVEGQGVVTVANGESLLLACPGSKNYQATTGERTAKATCNKGKMMIGKTLVNNETTSCTKSYAGSSIKVTNQKCGAGDSTGVIVQMGFELEDDTWLPLVDACHNLEGSVTYYATHQVEGASLRGGVKQRSTGGSAFTRGEKYLFKGLNPDSVYAREGQNRAFDKILGSGGADKYISSSSFLARGHLAPDADFIFGSHQLLTYYYINIAPQWQAVQSGNWLGIELAVRDLAEKVGKTLNVWTGTYEVLELEDTAGEKKEIYLEPTKKLIPAPELYWKVVQDPEEKTCTVAIVANNPFLTSAPKPICSQIKPSGWPTLTTLNKGYVYYCDFQDFQSAVDYMPDIDCGGGSFKFS